MKLYTIEWLNKRKRPYRPREIASVLYRLPQGADAWARARARGCPYRVIEVTFGNEAVEVKKT